MNVKIHLENNSNKDTTVNDGEFTVPPLPGASGAVNADSTTNPQQQTVNNNSHLQLLQMSGMQMGSSVKSGEQEENQEALFQQLYALGSSAPYGNQNQFLQHSMFGANGKSYFSYLSFALFFLIWRRRAFAFLNYSDPGPAFIVLLQYELFSTEKWEIYINISSPPCVSHMNS